MKKGVASQVFIYIFIVIVIALVLFFGFKQIVGLKKLEDKSTYIIFKTDFSEAVNEMSYKNADSVMIFSPTSRNKPLVLPAGIKQVCFENNKVSLVPEKYSEFEVENLKENNCIQVKQGILSFKLENVVDDQEMKVEVSAI